MCGEGCGRCAGGAREEGGLASGRAGWPTWGDEVAHGLLLGRVERQRARLRASSAPCRLRPEAEQRGEGVGRPAGCAHDGRVRRGGGERAREAGEGGRRHLVRLAQEHGLGKPCGHVLENARRAARGYALLCGYPICICGDST